ncbi:MAG TPA: acyl carrier protein [Polyangiaceae bacterium]|nr:acyl carrier protein [Polyangiaceae bacterium]
MTSIEQEVAAYILQEFLPGEDPSELTPTTPLISAGIIDSIATLKLVNFLENTFAISLAAHETDVDHLDTIERIGKLVEAKRA